MRGVGLMATMPDHNYLQFRRLERKRKPNQWSGFTQALGRAPRHNGYQFAAGQQGSRRGERRGDRNLPREAMPLQHLVEKAEAGAYCTHSEFGLGPEPKPLLRKVPNPESL